MYYIFRCKNNSKPIDVYKFVLFGCFMVIFGPFVHYLNLINYYILRNFRIMMTGDIMYCKIVFNILMSFA